MKVDKSSIDQPENAAEFLPQFKQKLIDMAIAQNRLPEDVTREDLGNLYEDLVSKLGEGYSLAQIQGISPDHLEAIYTLGHHTMQSGETEDAACIFHLLVTLEPTIAKYYSAFAACQQILKKYQYALEVYAMAQALDVSDPRIPQNAAVCCLHLGKLPESEGMLNRANSMCETLLAALPHGLQTQSEERVELQRLLKKGQQLSQLLKVRKKNQAASSSESV